MRYLYFLAFGPLLAACGPEETATPPPPKVAQYTIEQFMDNEKVGGSSFSPDGRKILYSSNISGVWNAYETKTKGGGKPVQLTSSDSSAIFAVSYFPTDDRFLFTSDRGGNEINHLYLYEDDGTVRDLTPDPNAKASFAGWSHDRQHFFAATNARDPQYFDVYRYATADPTPELFYQNDDGLDLAEISPDQRYLVLTKTITTNRSEMYLADRQTGETTLLSTPDADANYRPAYFSHDNKQLYYLTNEQGEFTGLRRYDLGSGTHHDDLSFDWDIMYAYLSHGGRYRVVGVNEDARNVIYVYDLQNDGQQVAFPEVAGDITSVRISDDESQMAFYAGSSQSPSNLYRYKFGSGEHQRLTNTLNPEIDPADLVRGEVVRYASFDGTEIPALLYRPHLATTDSLVPALVWVHGGPGGQSRLNYSPLVQYLVNHGYAILAVNNRGSSGYGKTFYAADDLKHGDEDLKDCIWGKRYLAETGFVDSNRVGIIGGSYGGYMTLAALAFAPDVFEVGVDIFGVSNWLRTLRSIPPWWASFREALYAEMGNPETDSAALYDKSPLFFADQITKPLMVLQGANDPRVLQVESDEIVAAVEASGVPVEYVVFEDEGHGFLKKENEIEGYEKTLAFLNEYLRDAPAKASP